MLSGTRSALAPCRPGPSGARMAWAPFSDGLRDFGAVMAAVFAYGMTGAAPCRPTRALCRHHTSIFLPRTASGRSACTLAAKFPNASRACGSDFVRAHRKAPKPERGKLPACRAFLHRHTQAPFDLALQTDTPPADTPCVSEPGPARTRAARPPRSVSSCVRHRQSRSSMTSRPGSSSRCRRSPANLSSLKQSAIRSAGRQGPVAISATAGSNWAITSARTRSARSQSLIHSVSLV